MSPTAVPLCPACHGPDAAWQIDSPVRALDRVVIDISGLRLHGLHAPTEGLEPVDHPGIACAACGAAATDADLRDAVLAAATAAARGESPRFDA
ncbi:MAG: hypothetical protein HYX54_08415 [Chloroflexi bacterium]|nr:hypothetical protein [Chloroflexota bacterium]